MSCFLLLNNSNHWQLTPNRGSVKAKHVNGCVFILAFVYGFLLAFSALLCLTAVQTYGLLLASKWFFSPKRHSRQSPWNVQRRWNRRVLWQQCSEFVLCADNVFKRIFLYWSIWVFWFWLGFWFVFGFSTLWPQTEIETLLDHFSSNHCIIAQVLWMKKTTYKSFFFFF